MLCTARMSYDAPSAPSFNEKPVSWSLEADDGQCGVALVDDHVATFAS
jgi:hypothetical protein